MSLARRANGAARELIRATKLKSRPFEPHPLFALFVGAAMKALHTPWGEGPPTSLVENSDTLSRKRRGEGASTAAALG
jgi:hypothetical protein